MVAASVVDHGDHGGPIFGSSIVAGNNIRVIRTYRMSPVSEYHTVHTVPSRLILHPSCLGAPYCSFTYGESLEHALMVFYKWVLDIRLATTEKARNYRDVSWTARLTIRLMSALLDDSG